MKKAIISIVCIVALVLIAYHSFRKEIWEINRIELKEAVLEAQTGQVELSKITQFEWDRMYSFAPYAPKDEIYAIVGYEWDPDISETVSEGMNQIVFMKDDEVVCYVYGYPENNGFGFYIEQNDGLSEYATVLYKKDQPVFELMEMDGVVYLIRK